MPDYKHMRAWTHQAGVCLIVVLVLLIGMSVVTLSTISDTGLQFKMVRNDQFYTSAYLAAYSEINAQLGNINANDETESDVKVLELLTYDVGEVYPIPQKELSGPHKGAGAFHQKVAFTLSCDPSNCPSPPGYTVSEITKVLRATIDSRADMVAAGAMSDQRQSIWYLLPQTDLVTFD